MSESTDLTAAEATEIVIQIAQNRGWVRPELRDLTDPNHLALLQVIEGLRNELGDVVETIAREIYSSKSRFILELIQNAEDNEFTQSSKVPSISFEVQPSNIIVECNEDGFTEANVQSICRTGKSSKRSRTGYIGEKGIGFKSVFVVASKIQIQSNSFSFYFQYNGGDSSEEKLGIITPIPEYEPIPQSERPLTRMTLTTLQTIPYDDLLAEFRSIPDTLLLFLSTLKELKIKIHDANQKISITTFHKSEDRIAGTINLVKIVEYLDDPEARDVKEDRYYVTRNMLRNLPVDRARLNIDECEIVLAFPVKDSEPLICAQDVFAFLPIRRVGLNFLIQADFILQANRQDVVDSARNKAILEGVSLAFRDAIVHFCTSGSPLRYKWVRFLPSSEAPDRLWTRLFLDIINVLKQERVLFAHGSSERFLLEDLRTLPISYLDRHDSPLFEDHPGSRVKYLSQSYESEDIETISKAFNMRDIGDGSMCDRIELDLESRASTMKDLNTEEDWHTRAAELITSIMQRNPRTRDRIRGLSLIPLADGSWVNASIDYLYFPPESGPEVPLDLIVTIDPKAARNTSRKKLFTKFGASRCPPQEVINRLWIRYLRQDEASDLSSSKAHLRYLYWNYENVEDDRFSRLWLYDRSERKVTSRQKILYFESDDEYGPQELLKAVQHPRNPGAYVPECQVPFLNLAYMGLFPNSCRRHELSWFEWLERALGVRRIPRLKFPGGALSTEFRHIIQYRPEKVVGVLKKYWAIYEPEMSPAIVDTLSQAEVTCHDIAREVLKSTYLPLPDLVERVSRLGISRGFPFLKIPNTSNGVNLLREWRFLADFGVGFNADLKFYVEILQLHEARNYECWDIDTRNKVLKTYESISDLCSNRDKSWILDKMDSESLILDPCVFRASVSSPSWIDVESCVWNGPENVLDKKPLASVPQYRDNQKLAHFFREILGVEDASWEDYLDMLVKLRRGSNPPADVSNKVLRLYHLFSESTISTEGWVEICDSFEQEKLIYMPSTSEWFAPSECLWTSPVPIDGKVIMSETYPGDLKDFFLQRLRISPASLGTLVEELSSMAGRNPTTAGVKRMIWAINAMDPKQGDLETLFASSILPIRRPDRNSNGNIFFQSVGSDFVVIDRNKLAEIFEGVTGLLDFTLEEVQQLHPFLQAMGLGKKYLSKICDEETACTDNGSTDNVLTREFKEKAYDLLRCAVSYRSSLTRQSARSLYDLLLGTSVLKTDGITTQYTLHQVSGDKLVHAPKGYVHIKAQVNGWQILVPQDRRDRELCYLRHLPEALAKLFQITLSAREIIGNVLNSSNLVIYDLLEAAGIGKVSEILPPQRPTEEFSTEEFIAAEEEVISLRSARTQSAPLEVLRNTSSQPGSPSALGLQNRESTSNLGDADADAGTSLSTSISPRQSEVSTRNTVTSNIRNDSHFSGFRIPVSNLFQVPADSFRRSHSPEVFDGANADRINAYQELLDNVIRIANRTHLPQRDHMTVPVNTQFHNGFDHASTFGVRSQGQMGHDIKIGAAGELFVFEILSNLLSPSFSRQDWKSTIRNEVTIHPRYHGMLPWQGAETADIVYEDNNSDLTTLLIQRGYLVDSVWRGASPRYLIEVKTTTGDWSDRFFMSNSQYLRMQRMTLTSGQAAEEVYVIFRVFNLGRNSLGVKIYLDPEAYRQRNGLVYEAQSWTVTPRV